MKVGQRLKEWREGKGMNQQAAARLVGVSQGTWSDLERDKVGPRGDTLQKLLRHGVIDASAFVEDDSETNPNAAE
jgi:transcriptional regulator with XRE-family HTH domain